VLGTDATEMLFDSRRPRKSRFFGFREGAAAVFISLHRRLLRFQSARTRHIIQIEAQLFGKSAIATPERGCYGNMGKNIKRKNRAAGAASLPGGRSRRQESNIEEEECQYG